MRIARAELFTVRPLQKSPTSSSPNTASSEPVFDVLPGAGDSRLVLVCDHSRNVLPPDYGDLGLCARTLRRHIAYDIGAEAVTRKLAALTGAPAVFAGFSRLLIDPNRGEDDPTLVMRISDGAMIPGNARIDAAEISKRTERFWRPYREACAARIDEVCARGQTPVLLGVHSFTPILQGRARPWHAGVLWDNDPRLALPLIDELRAQNLEVGDNEPYDGALVGDTMYELSTLRGLPGALVEIRQDLLADSAQCEAWAERLARALSPVLERPETMEHAFFGSRATPGGPA
jgi:predicted N-formylglutamate amidohydrolase